MKEEYQSKIEEIKKSLYSRTNPPKSKPLSQLEEKNFDIADDWDNGDSSYAEKNQDTYTMKKKKSHELLNKILLFSGLFFLLGIGYAFFAFTTGQATISSDNINIKVSGPISVAAGEVISLELEVKNNNDVTLELADLLIEYPEGTRNAEDISKELQRYRESLGTIKAGDRKSTTIESVIFGEEGDKKTILIGIEYRVPNSNAIFFVEREYEIEITSSPLSLEVSAPTHISTGEETEFVLTLTSNTTEVIKKVLIVAEYPFGFQYNENKGTKPSFDDSVWEIRDLSPGEKEKIVIRGTFVGQQDEERTIRFVVGLPEEFDEKSIGTPFLTHSRSVTIERPFLGLSLALNGSTSERVVASIGSDIRGDITWNNNLSSRITNVEMQVALKGDLLDRNSVSGSKGFFRSTDDTIVWDSRSVGEFNTLSARSSGSTGFSFSSLGLASVVGSFKDPTITLIATISGTSMDGSGIPEKVTTTIQKEVLLSTEIGLNVRGFYFDGPFINNGPLPPKVNQETTYTIVLSATNAINKVTGAKVKLVLPSYARWMSVVSPSTEKVTYSPVGGEIVWTLDDLEAGVGYSNPAREASFQIAVTPSISQIGTSPNLILNPRIEGRDVVTDTQLQSSVSRNITTLLRNDTGFINEYGSVVE